MTYEKQTWENEPSKATPLSAERFNHMEDGIAGAHAVLDGRLSEAGLSATIDGRIAASPLITQAEGAELRTARAALARNDLDLLIIGDSISEGTGPTAIEKRYPSRLRDELRRYLGIASGGRGYVSAAYKTPAQPDELWTMTGGGDYDLTYGLGRRCYRLNGAGQKAVLSVPAGHTDVDILFTGRSNTPGPSINQGAIPKVDGVAGSVTYLQNLAAPIIRDAVWPIATGLDPSVPHTIEIAWAEGQVLLTGAMLYAAGEKAGGVGSGVRLWDGARTGAGSDYFANPAHEWNYTINTIQPDLVIIELGRNNWSAQNRTPEQVAGDHIAIIDSAQAQTAVDPSIILVSVYGNKGATSGIPWSEYVAAIDGVARQRGALHVDLTRTLGTIDTAAANELGILTADLIHPSDLGSQMIANTLFNAIRG